MWLVPAIGIRGQPLISYMCDKLQMHFYFLLHAASQARELGPTLSEQDQQDGLARFQAWQPAGGEMWMDVGGRLQTQAKSHT